MKALSIFSALVILAATPLHATPAYRLLSNSSTAPQASTTTGGGFGGTVAPFNVPLVGPPVLGPSTISSGDVGGFGGSLQPGFIAQPKDPALAIPEPSSLWFLLALGIIPVLKLRSNRKSRAF